MRREELTKLRHNNQTKAYHWVTIAATVALLICLTFGTVSLEAKSRIDSSLRSLEPEWTETADINDTESPNHHIKELGEYTIELKFAADITAGVKVTVVAEGQEVEITDESAEPTTE